MPTGRSAAAWLSRVRAGERPLYAAIVHALDAAIREGELQPGDRLPPQRAVAETLGVDLTTVTRAYAAARMRGLLEGAVGRGTFVRLRPEDDDAGSVDLSMNLPPPPLGLSLGAMLAETLTGVLGRVDPGVLMAYHPEFGSLGQRRAAAEWLSPCLGEWPTDNVLVAPGAQSTLAAILSMLCKPGDVVVSEPLTYPGFRSIAAQLGLRLVPCPGDDDGPSPEALRDICAREEPRAVYLVPTMQNPTATTLSEDRRRRLARVMDRAGVWLIEDDPYSRLLEAPPPAITSLRRGRSVYIGTLAKTLSPGLRIAFVACAAPEDTQALVGSLRAVSQMPAPLMAAVVATWVREGRAEALLRAVRAEARARRALAAEMLPAARGAPESLHVWLPLANVETVEAVQKGARQRGLALVTHEAFAVGPSNAPGVRISLGGPGRRAVLADALRSLADVCYPETRR